MIKGMASKPDGTRVLVVGLSGENVTRLAADEPLLIRAGEMRQMGLPGIEVVIMCGKTEQNIVDQLRTSGMMPPGTPLHNACTDPTCAQGHAR